MATRAVTFCANLGSPTVRLPFYPIRIRCKSVSKRLVALSLDGFIAGPKGEADWIVMDPSIDFEALFKEFDTIVMGRRRTKL